MNDRWSYFIPSRPRAPGRELISLVCGFAGTPSSGNACIRERHTSSQASLMAQWVKNPPAMQETQEMRGWSLGQEDLWRRKWQPTLVFLPGKPHEQRSLVGYSSWVAKSWTRLSTQAPHGTAKLVTTVCESLYITLNLSPKLVSCTSWVPRGIL